MMTSPNSVIMIEKKIHLCLILLQTWTCGSLVVALEHVRKRAWNQLFLTHQTQLAKQRQLSLAVTLERVEGVVLV